MFSSILKVLMLSMMLMSPLLLASMESWILVWIMLEISSISFISILKDKYKNDGALIYFISQSIGSLMIMFSVMQEKSLLFNSMTSQTMLIMGMMIKLGLIPFHQWFVLLSMDVEWIYLFMLISIQKMAPLILISWNINNTNLFLFLMASMLVSMFIQISQTSFKKLFIYSSIFQTSWLSMIMFLNQTLSMIYYILYTIIMLLIILDLKILSMQTIVEEKIDMSFMINMASLAGIPPMMGFIPKWMISKTMIKESMFVPLVTLMIISSVISIFIYMRFFFKMWMKTKNQFFFNINLSVSSMIQILAPFSMLMIL